MKRTKCRAFQLLCSATIAGISATAGSTGAAAEPSAGGSALVTACAQARRGETGSNAGFCNGYLLGYLQASPQVVFNSEVPSAYMERVLRTRAPDHPQTQSVKSASFCLEGEAALDDVRTHVAGFDNQTAANISSAKVVEQVLQQHYRCPR